MTRRDTGGVVPAAIGTASEGVSQRLARVDHVHGGAPGTELAYGEITANVSITGTTSAAATTVVSSGAVTYDGTAVVIEFFTNDAVRGTSYVGLVLYDGATELGILGYASLTTGQAVMVRRKLTPSAASHTYQIKAYVDAGAGTVRAGTGAAGANMPAFCRVTKA